MRHVCPSGHVELLGSGPCPHDAAGLGGYQRRDERPARPLLGGPAGTGDGRPGNLGPAGRGAVGAGSESACSSGCSKLW